MKILKKIDYQKIDNLKETVKVKEIYCLPVFREGVTPEEADELDMTNFIHPWKENWDWYFSEKIDDKRLELIEDVYFSKEDLNNKKFDYLDYILEADVYMFTKKIHA